MKMSWMAIALMCAGTLAASTACGREGQTVNLITNGGFEEGTAGWTPDLKHELITQPKVAHSGNACLSGEITNKNESLILTRKVPVRAGCNYRFEIWAKATNKTRLVLWIIPPGKTNKDRVSQGSWSSLPNTWKKYTSDISVKTDGDMELRIVAPSSHNAPAGRIWIDDIALYETELPPITSLSGGEGFNDEGVMAQADDGSLYAAWNSFRAGADSPPADSLQLARYETSGKQVRKTGHWTILSGPGTYIMNVRAVSAGAQVYLLYAAEVDHNWDIYAVACTPQGPRQPIRISRGPEVDIKPFGAWHEKTGQLWVTWESNIDGWRQICAAVVKGDQVSKPTRLTAPGASNYSPSIAVLHGGTVAVAWHSFRENNFDVFLRQRSADGNWEPERRLTKAPTIDRHAVLLARDNELWIVYENAIMSTTDIDSGTAVRDYAIGSTRTRRLIVAQITPDGLLVPKNYLTTSPIYKSKAEAPAPVFDSSGRLWLACRTPSEGTGAKTKSRGWMVSLTCLNGRQWMPPIEVSTQKGMDRYPSIALTGGRVWILHQADDTPQQWDTEEQAKTTGQSDIYLASVEQGVDPSVAWTLEPLVEPSDRFAPGKLRVQRGEDLPTPSITYQGQKFNLYFGDLHDHSDISICNRTVDESVDESYANMRDIVRNDFACVTDHDYNQNPYLWYLAGKNARVNDDPGRFLTFLAEEWTSKFKKSSAEHPYGFYGHRNLIFADPYFPRWWNAVNRQTPAQVWEELRKMDANFVQIPHQLADAQSSPTDWNFTDETAQPVAEIFQSRGSYEYKGAPREAGNTTPLAGYFLQDAWARGIVIGVIAAPDHGGGYGKACVYASGLNREAILDALRARRCYGTTAAKIFLDVRVNDHLMGEKVAATPAGPVNVAINVRCPADLDRIEVCRNNQFIYTSNPQGTNAHLQFVDREPLAGRSYYYVRVVQKDGEIAWSSPVWFGAP